jgi:hypothetical protein
MTIITGLQLVELEARRPLSGRVSNYSPNTDSIEVEDWVPAHLARKQIRRRRYRRQYQRRGAKT